MISKSIAHYRVTKMLGKGGEGGEAGEVVVGMRVDTREATLEVIRKKEEVVGIRVQGEEFLAEPETGKVTIPKNFLTGFRDLACREPGINRCRI